MNDYIKKDYFFIVKVLLFMAHFDFLIRNAQVAGDF